MCVSLRRSLSKSVLELIFDDYVSMAGTSNEGPLGKLDCGTDRDPTSGSTSPLTKNVKK